MQHILLKCSNINLKLVNQNVSKQIHYTVSNFNFSTNGVEHICLIREVETTQRRNKQNLTTHKIELKFLNLRFMSEN